MCEQGKDVVWALCMCILTSTNTWNEKNSCEHDATKIIKGNQKCKYFISTSWYACWPQNNPSSEWLTCTL